MASADISVALQKLLKGAEEDIAGNYFKPVRANKLIAQAHETQRAVSKWKGTISYRQTCHVKGSTTFHGNFQNMQICTCLDVKEASVCYCPLCYLRDSGR